MKIPAFIFLISAVSPLIHCNKSATNDGFLLATTGNTQLDSPATTTSAQICRYSHFLTLGNASLNTAYFCPETMSFVPGPDLSNTAFYGGHMFKISFGIYAGKYVMVHGGTLNSTTIIDPANGTTIAGPTLTAITNGGTHSFAIPSGTHSGKNLVIHSNGATSTSLYEPATNTFSAGPALTLAANNGGHSFPIATGSQAGKVLVILEYVGNYS